MNWAPTTLLRRLTILTEFQKNQTQTIIIWSCCFPLYVCACTLSDYYDPTHIVHSWPYWVVLLFSSCSPVCLRQCGLNLTVRRRHCVSCEFLLKFTVFCRCFEQGLCCGYAIADGYLRIIVKTDARCDRCVAFILRHVMAFKCTTFIKIPSPRLALIVFTTELTSAI